MLSLDLSIVAESIGTVKASQFLTDTNPQLEPKRQDPRSGHSLAFFSPVGPSFFNRTNGDILVKE
jgi:hypothetical protein